MPYIDQERVVQDLTEACDELDLRFLRARIVRETIDTVKNHINAMPTADVALVVHGRWDLIRGGDLLLHLDALYVEDGCLYLVIKRKRPFT